MDKYGAFDGKQAEMGDVPADNDGEVRRLRRTPSDEMLLTEVGIDSEDIVIYDISGLYCDITTEVVHCRIKCFKNKNENGFFLILDDSEQIKRFTSTFLITLLQYVSTQNANRLIICLRKDLDSKDKVKMNKSLRFIGFRKMSKGEQKTVSITETHTLYCINIDA